MRAFEKHVHYSVLSEARSPDRALLWPLSPFRLGRRLTPSFLTNFLCAASLSSTDQSCCSAYSSTVSIFCTRETQTGPHGSDHFCRCWGGLSASEVVDFRILIIRFDKNQRAERISPTVHTFSSPGQPESDRDSRDSVINEITSVY